VRRSTATIRTPVASGNQGCGPDDDVPSVAGSTLARQQRRYILGMLASRGCLRTGPPTASNGFAARRRSRRTGRIERLANEVHTARTFPPRQVAPQVLTCSLRRNGEGRGVPQPVASDCDKACVQKVLTVYP